jgi:hypothetical protein
MILLKYGHKIAYDVLQFKNGSLLYQNDSLVIYLLKGVQHLG